MAEERRLTRSTRDKVISGVLGGLGEYYGIGSNLLRVLFVVISLFLTGIPVIVYLVLWVALPLEDSEDEASQPSDDL